MSIVMNLAPFVDIMLLKRILATIISNVGVATSPGWSIGYLLTVNLVVLFYFPLWSHASDELSLCHIFFAILWNIFLSSECDCVGWICLCVRQLHLLGVQIHLQMTCSNFIVFWVSH